MYIIKKTGLKKLDMFDIEWEKADVANVGVINWDNFPYAPKTKTQILYNDFGLWVRMQTDEKDTLARCTKQNGPVSDDICMEFFFRLNENDPVVDKNLFDIKSFVEEGNWIIQFFVPFSYIDSVFDGHTKTMYGNFYKCGVDTKIEHYFTYAPVVAEKPDFHHPESFVEFVLE